MKPRFVVAAIAVAGLFTSVSFSATAQQQPTTQQNQQNQNQPINQQNQQNQNQPINQQNQQNQQNQPTTQQNQQNRQPNQNGGIRDNAAPGTTAPRTQANLNQMDRMFMIQAAQGGMAEVMLGQLAIERAAYPETKAYARQMVQDHTRANNELIQIARAKGVTLPTEVNAQQQALRTRLGQIPGSRFDQIYMQEAGVNAHAQQQALYQQEVQQGQDADVRAFAARILPAVSGHLAMGRNMAIALNQGRRPQGMMNQSNTQPGQMNQNNTQSGQMNQNNTRSGQTNQNTPSGQMNQDMQQQGVMEQR